MTRRPPKRKLADLHLLCASGVGLAPVAPRLCRSLREIVGAEAGAIFWMGDDGLPEGFFHEDSPAEARDLFANEFERLFVGPGELNVSALACPDGPAAGRLLAPPSAYWASNTFNLLVRASGHRHSLDLRVDHAGRPRAVVLLFRARRPFDAADLALLEQTAPALRRSVGVVPEGERWLPRGAPAHLLVDASGRRLLFASPAAGALLRAGNHVAQGVPASGELREPPLFVRGLAARLAGEPRPSLRLPVPAGRLTATAEALAASDGGEPTVLVALQEEMPARLAAVDRVLDLELSPKQKSLLLAAAAGASRLEAARTTGTGPEAMKKHLAVIFSVTGARAWTDLSAFGDVDDRGDRRA